MSQTAQGAVRCPIAFEWRDVFGEGDTLKRSDTAAVTWLLNLFPGAGSQSRPTPERQTLPRIRKSKIALSQRGQNGNRSNADERSRRPRQWRGAPPAWYRPRHISGRTLRTRAWAATIAEEKEL